MPADLPVVPVYLNPESVDLYDLYPEHVELGKLVLSDSLIHPINRLGYWGTGQVESWPPGRTILPKRRVKLILRFCGVKGEDGHERSRALSRENVRADCALLPDSLV
jgi:hypothetical protein